MSWLVDPHLKRASSWPEAKLYGRIGLSLLSVRVEADGPSPLPCGPWHFQHSSLVNSALPWAILSIVTGGSAGTLMGSPGFSFSQRSENVLMKATRLARSWWLRVFQIGMFELVKPRPIEL